MSARKWCCSSWGIGSAISEACCSSTSVIVPGSRDRVRQGRRGVDGEAKRLRSEFVVGGSDVFVDGPPIQSTRSSRPARSWSWSSSWLLNEAKTPPFPIADETPVAEDVRLKCRYLDLRRPRLQSNIVLRHRVTSAVRRYFDENGFLEIETPILTKSTPEVRAITWYQAGFTLASFCPAPIAAAVQADPDGRRDGPICTDLQMLPRRGPARGSAAGVHAGRRRDVVRAPDTVFGVIEPLMKQVFAVIGREITTPFPQMPYAPMRSRSMVPTNRICAVACRFRTCASFSASHRFGCS